eukprot:SAG22_NODE_63_length_23302_cov_17.506551_10_plen_84_part_00
MPGNKVAVLAINAAALPQKITVDVATVFAPDHSRHGPAAAAEVDKATATDVWTGQSLGAAASSYTDTVPPHGNIFLILAPASA